MQDRVTALYESTYGGKPLACEPLKGDGSGRRLWRLTERDGGTVIGAYGPDLKENAAFLGFSKHFRKAGLPVPEIYAEDAPGGVYLEEDLGERNLFELLTARRGEAGLPRDVVAVYEKAVDALPRFQIDGGRGLDYALCYPRARFDEQSMLWDLNYFKYYFLRLAGIPFDEQDLEDDFQTFVGLLKRAPSDYFLYRDFQSRNIMVRDGAPWFIDYQGGRRGALQYDVASLLYDAKADLPFPLRDALLSRYLDAASARTKVDRQEFLSLFPAFVYIRIMQALGAYGLRGFYERKSHFLLSIPYALRNLERLLSTTELPVKVPALMEVFRRLVGSAELRRFAAKPAQALRVRVQSFSYKNGYPSDESGHGGGFVFDCRFLPNPGREKRFAESTGQDAEVIAWLEREPAVGRFYEHARAVVEMAVDNYTQRKFGDLTISFGCTGGRHRSVYFAERLAKHLGARADVQVELRHRAREAAGA